MLSDDFLPAATGVGTHVQMVSTLLAARGHEVTVITSRRPGELPFDTWKGVDVLRVFTIKLFGFYQAVPLARSLEQFIRRWQPDVIHYHYLGLLLLVGMKVARRLHLPQIYTYHMTADHLTQPFVLRPFRPFIARQIERCCNQMDQVVSVSENLACRLRVTGINTPIQYISNPVDYFEDRSFVPVHSADSFKIFFAGRLNPEKNVPFLLRAFAKLLAEVPAAKLWIAGEGSQRTQLQQLAGELKIGHKVEFLGFLDRARLAGYYAACDVFVLPSLVETQGLVALEAMHFSKPLVVARSVVSATELVDEGVNGFLVDANADADLADRLGLLARDASLRQQMGLVGRGKADRCRPETVVEQLDALYRQAHSRSAKSPT